MNFHDYTDLLYAAGAITESQANEVRQKLREIEDEEWRTHERLLDEVFAEEL